MSMLPGPDAAAGGGTILPAPSAVPQQQQLVLQQPLDRNNNNNAMVEQQRSKKKSSTYLRYLPSVGTVLTTAAVAYGTYHLASWAWKKVRNRSAADEDEEEIEQRLYGDIAPSQSKQQQHVRFQIPDHVQQHDPLYQNNEHNDENLMMSVTAADAARIGSRQNPMNHNPHPPPPQNAKKWRHIRRQRMIRCRDETTKALDGFLRTVRRIIDERTDTTNETKLLKKLRAQRNNNSNKSSQNATTAATAIADGSSNGGTGSGGESKNELVHESVRRQQERELWDIIKVRSMTRTIVTAYAHTVLFLVLTVQVNLLGGRLFDEAQQAASSSSSSALPKPHGAAEGDDGEDEDRAYELIAKEKMDSYRASHRFVLTHTYEYFFERGLISLLHIVERAVTDVMRDWNVLDPAFLRVPFTQINTAIQDIRTVVEQQQHQHQSPQSPDRSMTTTTTPPSPTEERRNTNNGQTSSPLPSRRTGLLRFIMPPGTDMPESEGGIGSSRDALGSLILDETWDLLESPVFYDAQIDCLETTFDVMRDQYWGTAFAASLSSANTPSDDGTETTTLPLATILTKYKKTANSFFVNDDEDKNKKKTSTTAATYSDEEDDDDSKIRVVNFYCTSMEQLRSVQELADVSFN